MDAGPQAESRSLSDYAMAAGTTAMNAQRLLRALKLQRPVLLEGSPGVGKTSLVAALAKACGNPLVRINLSEQTVVVDIQQYLRTQQDFDCDITDVNVLSWTGHYRFVWNRSPCGGGQGRGVCMARWAPVGCVEGRSLGSPGRGKLHSIVSNYNTELF